MLERVDTRMEVDQGSESDCRPVSDRSRRELERGEEEMEPPGPASSKGGRVTRSRCNSITSVSSNTGSAPNALDGGKEK